jgi:putative ATP-dependent endonuclease of OLD family
MKLVGLQISNYRSILNSGEIRVEPLQAFVGENNAGKSNILRALEVFLTPGTGGVIETDFFDPLSPIIITATFDNLTISERKKMRIYLLGEKLVIQKHIVLKEDIKSRKLKPNAEYHGYKSKPKDWWLSTDGVIEHEGTIRPNWKEIAETHDIIDYVKDAEGKVNKSTYETGLQRILIERDDIEFEEPELGQTQALGIHPNLLAVLPRFYLLPAITDYSDEIDRRTSSTSFRLLMGELTDRILKHDPRYQQIEMALKNLKDLLNPPATDEIREEGRERLILLDHVEKKLKELISKLMPSVNGVCLNVEVEEIRDIFSRGVSIGINDGKLTDVLLKGHGLQRCVVFGLLQALILNLRGQLIPTLPAEERNEEDTTIILAIEEPELYIHPQMQRLIYSVLKEFAQTDQVIYTTHSPAFIEVARYDEIGLVCKECVEKGTTVRQCDSGVLDAETEQKTFRFLQSFGFEQNQMFFAQRVILVEGPEDVIAVLATGRDISLFREFPEEIGYTLVATGSKDETPKYMKLLNAFKIPYVVLHELDKNPQCEKNEKIIGLLGENRRVVVQGRLEDTVAHTGHFSNSYTTKKYFEIPENISDSLRNIIRQLFEDNS